jgi:hypothetical protein
MIPAQRLRPTHKEPMMHPLLRLPVTALLLGLTLQTAAAQTAPTPGQAKEVIDAVKNLPDQAADKAADLAKQALPPELAPLADTAATLGKTLANVADGKIIADAVGTAFDKFGGVMAEILGSGQELRARLDRLEKENTEKMIEIEHSKASLAALDQKLVSTTAALTELLEAHNKRLTELEARVAKLEAERGVFKAPFKVVNASGTALFSIAADGRTVVGSESGASIAMKASGADSAFIQLSSGAKKMLLATDSGDASILQLNDGADAVVKLYTGQGDNAFLRVAGGTSNAIINADPSNSALMQLQAGQEGGLTLSSKAEDLGLMIRKSGQNAAGLGASVGKGVALRIFNSAGQAIVAGGENPGGAGTGILYVGDGTGNKAALAVDTAQGGLVYAFAPDGTVGAGLVGADRAAVAFNAAGAPVATISKSDKSEGGTVVARNPAGEGIFAAGFAAEYGGGEACVWRAKRSNTFCLGLGMPGMGVGK